MGHHKFIISYVTQTYESFYDLVMTVDFRFTLLMRSTNSLFRLQSPGKLWKAVTGFSIWRSFLSVVIPDVAIVSRRLS